MSNPNNNIYIKHDIKVIDSFIDKFARRYIEQRSQSKSDLSSLGDGLLFKHLGFDTELLKNIISKNSVAKDFSRDSGKAPDVLRDIYRSDLGELLMTYYFEEKLDDGSRFIIPLKNITYREREDMPGKGMDAIGYQVNGDKIDILLGEAKVSAEQKNPPAVVDKSKDSIYATQKKYNDDLQEVIKRLSDYCRRLDAKDAAIIGMAIINLDKEDSEHCSLTFGCSLIRDDNCMNEEKDFGKMKTNAAEFIPNKIHFSILSFTEKNIEETVQLFYDKVQELTQ